MYPEIQCLYSPGSDECLEDGGGHFSPFVFVCDPLSEAYARGSEPQKIYPGGLTGGQIIRKIFQEGMCAARSDSPLAEVIFGINEKVRDFALAETLPLDSPDYLPGCSFAALRLGEHIEIVQAGDCMVFWLERSGASGYIPTQGKGCEKERVETYARILGACLGDRPAAWKQYLPFFRESRNRYTNSGHQDGYALLNGQQQFVGKWQHMTIDASQLHAILLLTDGLVPVSWLDNESELASRCLSLFFEGGLSSIRSWTRQIEAREKHLRHVDYREGTGVALLWNL